MNSLDWLWEHGHASEGPGRFWNDRSNPSFRQISHRSNKKYDHIFTPTNTSLTSDAMLMCDRGTCRDASHPTPPSHGASPNGSAARLAVSDRRRDSPSRRSCRGAQRKSRKTLGWKILGKSKGEANRLGEPESTPGITWSQP